MACLMATHTAFLLADALGFSYPQGAVFANVSLHASAGVCLVRGGDGRGKSTLLRVLAGDLPAGSGSLQLKGIDLKAQPDAYKAQVFWMDFKTTAFNAITAKAFLHAAAAQHGAFDPLCLPALIEGLSLQEHMDKPLYMLSTGSKRKVWLAAAFASGAALTLLDDPFAALDKPSIRFVTAQLAAATGQLSRVFVVAHYESLGAVPLVCQLDLGD
jgi:ABC-type transport system involved in cytochrome c biogenesis ATPase subunit